MGKQFANCNLGILVKRNFRLGSFLLERSDSLVAFEATGDGARWSIRYDHGGPIDTVEWAQLEELKTKGYISIDW